MAKHKGPDAIIIKSSALGLGVYEMSDAVCPFISASDEIHYHPCPRHSPQYYPKKEAKHVQR